MKLLKLLVFSLAWASWTLPAQAVPTHIKHCVERTAADIQQASSAADLQRRLAGMVQKHVLGIRTYKRLWLDIKAQGKVDAAVNRYLHALYYRALADSQIFRGGITKITVTGLDGISRPWNANDQDRMRLTAYHVKVSITASNTERVTNVIVMAMFEYGRCKFGDISLLDGSSEVWFSNNVDSSPLNLQQRGN